MLAMATGPIREDIGRRGRGISPKLFSLVGCRYRSRIFAAESR
jgi:hypothetical protein